MPNLATQDANTVLNNPEFGFDALLVAALLAALGVLLLMITLFWINRRMKKALGLHGDQSDLRRPIDNRDPWVEAGQRLDNVNLDAIYKKNPEEDRPS